MKKIIIFGIGDSAELAKYYFENDIDYKEEYKIVAFTIDKKYKKREEFLGLPLVAFEDIEKIFSPKEYFLFNTLGYSKINTLREEKYLEGKNKGYKYINYISSKATVLINEKDIGENNFIEEGVLIQPFVKIGNNNVIRYGVAIGHHTEIFSNCFIAPKVSVAGRVRINNNCFLGIGSTIRDHIILEEKTLIGGGAWISCNTEKNSVYISNKAIRLNKNSEDIKI